MRKIEMVLINLRILPGETVNPRAELRMSLVLQEGNTPLPITLSASLQRDGCGLALHYNGTSSRVEASRCSLPASR